MYETTAFIDVGTNSIHMLIVRFYGSSLGVPVFQDKESVRMGRSLYESGRIDDEALEKVRVILSDFVGIAHHYRAENMVAIATCAAERPQIVPNLFRWQRVAASICRSSRDRKRPG